jgi:putative nucleotidyltransferase with HDIG domain
MPATATPHLIDVDALRIGMFIHLDLGWMVHPFPLSSFKISSAQQIETLRSLNIQSVRWSPDQSDSPAADMPPAAGRPPEPGPGVPSTAAPAATAAAPLPAAKTASLDRSREVPGSQHRSPGDPEAAPGDGAGTAGPLTATECASAGAAAVAAIQRNAATPPPPFGAAPNGASEARRRLDEQQGALRFCERQYGEATRALKQTAEMVATKPQEARAQAEALTGALLRKMLGQQELCIRLLSETAGFNAAMHGMNVAVIALLMGRSLGLPEAELVDLGVGAMLHDLGKVDMPFRLRERDDRFTAVEQRDYEEHVAHGLALARRMGLSPGATLVIAQHHEHVDGTGFPLKLSGDSMTLPARIVALVNRYDNLCNPHLVAKALTPHESISLLFAQGRGKFDPSILSAFIRMMGVYPPGSLVQLTDDRFGLVVSVNSARPLKPNVLIYERAVRREDALVFDLEQAGGVGIRRSLKTSQLPTPAIEYLAPRQRVTYFFEPAGLGVARP